MSCSRKIPIITKGSRATPRQPVHEPDSSCPNGGNFSLLCRTEASSAPRSLSTTQNEAQLLHSCSCCLLRTDAVSSGTNVKEGRRDRSSGPERRALRLFDDGR